MDHLLAARGGFAGLGVLLAQCVLWGYSIVSLAIILERIVVLRRERENEARIFNLLREIARSGSADRFEAAFADADSPAVRAIREADDSMLDADQRRERLDDEIERQTSLLSRNLTILATVASTAPYVGLFGTVLGILRAFAVIAATGQTGAGVVAGGISEALVTTAIGLGVAIPAVIAYNLFSHRVNSLSFDVDSHARELLARRDALRSGGNNSAKADAS